MTAYPMTSRSVAASSSFISCPTAMSAPPSSFLDLAPKRMERQRHTGMRLAVQDAVETILLKEALFE